MNAHGWQTMPLRLLMAVMLAADAGAASDSSARSDRSLDGPWLFQTNSAAAGE